jgi:Right handed beta helix region
LQTALNAGGTIHVCPGRYESRFTIDSAVTIIGAGESDDAASNTILDANGAGLVVLITTGSGLVALERLRVTGGNSNSIAGGILHLGMTLRMTDCTVSGNTGANSAGGGIFGGVGSTLEMTRCTVRDNHATGSRGVGGGVASQGTTTLTDCLIEANRADGAGGGLYISSGLTILDGSTQVRGNEAVAGGGIGSGPSTLVIAETCRVTENMASPGKGGGIFNNGGTVRLLGADPSPIVVNNCHENCGGTVPKCSTAPPVMPCP